MEISKVEKGIEIPPQRRTKKWPIHDMKVGDSFFVKIEDNETVRRINSRVSAALYDKRRKHGMKFTMRTYENGVRVWRIK